RGNGPGRDRRPDRHGAGLCAGLRGGGHDRELPVAGRALVGRGRFLPVLDADRHGFRDPAGQQGRGPGPHRRAPLRMTGPASRGRRACAVILRYPRGGESMQSFAHLRRLAALIPLALALGAGPRPAAAQEQHAISNAIPVVSLAAPGDIENPPRNVRGALLLADDGNIYFGTTGGGKGAGAIGRLTPGGELSTLYALADNGSEGVSRSEEH